MGEFLPGYEASGWQGVGAPRNRPADMIERLNRKVNAGLVDAKLRARIIELGGIPLPVSPAEFGKVILDETEKWGKVVKFSGAKPD